MGKYLVIKETDFSSVAVDRHEIGTDPRAIFTGTQYLNTGIALNLTDSVEVVLSGYLPSSSAWLFGYRSEITLGLLAPLNQEDLVYEFRYKSSSGADASITLSDVSMADKCTFSIGNGSIKIDNTVVGSYNVSSTLCAGPCFLGTVNKGDLEPDPGKVTANIYSFKISDAAGNLKLSLIPDIVNNVGGFTDEVSGNFIAPVGTLIIR